MSNINTTTAVLFLTIYTILSGLEDLYKREIHTGRSMLFAGTGLLFSLLLGRNLIEIGQALLPGLVFLALSKISRGSVGMGDAIYLLVCAAYTDLERLLWMIAFSLLLSAVGALCIIARGTFQCTKMKYKTIPYLTFMIPALFVSFLIYKPV